MTELELVDGCKKKDRTIQQILYEIYSPQMLGICLRYIGDQMTSQDILHDGFIKVFLSFDSFHYRGEGSLKAWMSRIFTNTCLEYLRKNNALKETVALDEWKESTGPEEAEYDLISTDALMQFISELPAGYRTIFNMYVIDDFSHKEIGEKLNINESSSRSQLSRAKNILANKIKKYIKENE
jgi:RNA polymerase sigma factor, sigma-70 family